MKRKLLLAALCVVGALGMRAQTDVTSTYITNPSFESDGAISASNGALAITGWTQSDPSNSFNNTGCYDASTAVPTQGTVTVKPSNGDYFLFFRKGWAQSTYTFTSASTASLPVGAYTLSVDYKMVEGYDGTQNNNTKVIISAKSGDDVLGSYEGTTKSNVKASDAYTYLNTAGWSKSIAHFIVTSPTSVNVVISLQAGGQRRSDFVVDNVRLYYTPFDAAPTTYSEVGDGEFYIVNAATGKYLGGSNGWGTQASLIEHGIPFTLASSSGAYTFDSKTYNNANSHFFNGTYVDGGSTSLYVESIGGGKYSISTESGSAYITAKSSATVDNTAANAESPLAQWYFVSKTNRDALFVNATNAAPVDATYYLTEANISRNLRKAYNTKAWTGDYAYGGANENQCAERYCAVTDVNQTVTVPNGKYTVSCQGFYRRQSAENTSYLYANDAEVALNRIEFGGVNSMTGASEAFSVGEYKNSLPVYVTDGSLKVGIKCDAATNWTLWDNFELLYHGPIIGGEATEIALDTETAMTADKWYYIDIPVDGMYNLTTTALSNIVYTTDGTILIENEGNVTDKFSKAENEELTAGRYYVKSSTNQNLKVTVGAYAYEVGSPTLSVADGKYTQSSTFTVTFPDAASNDPAAAAALVASSKATVNGTEVALTAVTGGFSLDLGTLTPATDYAIAIPADVYGYEGQAMNTVISLTVHTPQIFDGTYVFYDAVNKGFLGRGAAWGTEAVVDKYGIPFNLKTNESGVSSLEFVDWTGVYLFKTNDNGMFTDNASTGWIVQPSGSNYRLKDANSDLYAKVDEGTYGFYVHAVEGNGNATAWTLMNKTQRDAIIATYPTQNIANVITAAGLGDIAQAYMAAHPEITDIKAAATAYVAANYNTVDCTSLIGTAKFSGAVGDWTWSQVRSQNNQPAYGTNFAEVWCATGTYTQTIGKDNLPAGIYKLTVQGYERRCANDAATALYNAGYNLVSTYLAANGEQVRFTDWNEVEGKPTNVTDAVTAFNNGEAVNTVFVYLDGDTDLTITVKKPNYIWDNWAIFNNFTLTRYEQASAILAVNDEVKYGTFAAPFNVTVPAGVTAYTVTAGAESNEELTLTEVATIEANKPVLLYAENGYAATTVKGKTVAAEEVTNGLLTGVYEVTPAPVGSYVLQYLNEKAAFYQVVAGDELPTVGANRAYLTLPTAGSKPRAIYFDAEGEATGIAAYDVLTSGQYDGIYTANGVQIPRLQKGLNVVKKGNKSYKIYVK